jgi:hypothetical protein
VAVFLRNHRDAIAAMDLFTVPTLTFGVLYCFFVIDHDRRKILHLNVTGNPNAPWVALQLRQTWGYDQPQRFLIFDRDAKFNADVARVFDILAAKFGFTTNAKGYRVLPPYVRVIQGDGVNLFTIQNVLYQLAKFHGWSADNISFGMGGALLQQLNRDTQRFALKCSAARINREWRPVFKEPVNDLEKISKHGRLALTRNSTGELTTLENVSEHGVQNDLLEVVFENGDVVREHDLDAIRERAHLGPGQAGANVFR